MFRVGNGFFQQLKLALPDLHIDLTCSKLMRNDDYAYGLITVFNQQFEYDNITDILIDNNIVSDENKGRFQAFEINNQLVANFHADFNAQDKTKQDIKNLLELNYLVAGDFNLKELPDVKVPYTANTTVPGIMPTDTYDGIFGETDAFECQEKFDRNFKHSV